MKFENLSVAGKIWALLGCVISALLCTGAGLLYAVDNNESATRAHIQDYAKRMQLAVQWNGITDLAVSYVELAALSSEPAFSKSLMGKFESVAAQGMRIEEALEARIQSAEGRQRMEAIHAARDKVMSVNQQISLLRDSGDVDAANAMMQQQFKPSVEAYKGALDALVQLQEKFSQQTVQEAAKATRTMIAWGAGIGAVVVLLALCVARSMVRQVVEPLHQAVTATEKIAAGDLTVQIHSSRKDEFGHLLRSLSGMAQRLHAVVGEVRSGVESVSAASSQIASGNQDLSARTEQTASNLEETAASMEELTSTVTQSAETARQANQLAGAAAEAAQRGGDVVQQVVHSMQQITDSSRRINDIIGVIDGIAFQTNILALNAAVEAARAGEQGRGFAVVAGEVRSLAGRSAEAAKEIKALITTSVQNVESGSQQVAQAGDTMQEIVQSVRRVTDLIGEITAASTEQRDGIAQVNMAVTNLDQMTQQNAALVEESSAAAAAMREQAQRLEEVVAVFQVGPQTAGQRMATSPTAFSVPRQKPVQPLKPHRVEPAVRIADPTVRKAPALAPAQHAPVSATKTPVAAPLKRPETITTGASSADDDWETF